MEYVVIGKIGKTFGVKGWVKVYAFTEPNDKILTYQPWYLKQKAGWQVIEIEASRWNGEQLVIKLPGIETPEQAKLLANLQIGAVAETLPSGSEQEGYFWRDLEGLKVITTHGVALGKIDHLIETGANDVFVVKGDKERVLPYLPNDVVVKVDLAKGEMIVNWDPEF